MSAWLDFTDGNKRAVTDGDGLVGESGERIRIPFIDAYEVAHGPNDIFGTNQGLVQKRILQRLIEEKGFNTVNYLGEKSASKRQYEGPNIERELATFHNPNGLSVSDLMYYEGLLNPRGSNIRENDIKIWEQGQMARARHPETSDPYYAKMREELTKAASLDMMFPKTRATTERDFREDVHSGVIFRHQDRDLYDNADSPFIAGVASGLDGLQAGLYGVMEMLGDRMGIEALERFGRDGVDFQNYEIYQLPYYVKNIDDVNSVKSFADWAAGALGGSLPYFGLMAAGFIPGLAPYSFGAMSLVYTGQTWNEMKGLPSEKDASTALVAGILQSFWERLGGHVVFKMVKPQDLATKKGVNKAIDEIVASGRKSAVTGKVLTRKEADALIKEARKAEIVSILRDFKRNDIVWKGYASMVAKKAGAGMIGEGSTEAAQEATQYIGAYLGSPESLRKFDLEEFSSIMRNAAAAGALIGGGIAGGKSALTEVHPYSSSARDFSYWKGANMDVDTSPVADMNQEVEEMGTRHLDPSDNQWKPTVKRGEKGDEEVQTSEEKAAEMERERQKRIDEYKKENEKLTDNNLIDRIYQIGSIGKVILDEWYWGRV